MKVEGLVPINGRVVESEDIRPPFSVTDGRPASRYFLRDTALSRGIDWIDEALWTEEDSSSYAFSRRGCLEYGRRG